MSKQIPINTPHLYREEGSVHKQVHLFDRWSPLSSINGQLHYLCGARYTGKEPYYHVDVSFEIGFGDTPLSVEGYERCPNCWNKEDIGLAMLRQIP